MVLKQKSSTLFGGGLAVVIGLPAGFDLQKQIRSAKELRLATAFAHMSGWKKLEGSVKASGADVRLLTGLDFCQTEPSVLRSWLKLCRGGRTQAKMCNAGTVFHPKVLIVQPVHGKRFAIVGSGNLSAGGLISNAECGVYVSARAQVDGLLEWFDDLFESQSTPLSSRSIKLYQAKFDKSRRALQMLRAEQKEAEVEMQTHHQATMAKMEHAAKKARRFLETELYRRRREGNLSGAREIKRALDFPRFEFDRNGWETFWRVRAMGHLVPLPKNRLWKQRRKLQKGLSQLLNGDLSIEVRVDALCRKGSPLKVSGFGMNAVSKILCVHEPKRWPVLNNPVLRTLKAFGYEPPSRATVGERYAAYARLMTDFRRKVGARDMLDLDAFFHTYAVELQRT